MSDLEPPDMSPEAIDRRLRKQSELLDFCQRLRKEAALPGQLERVDALTAGAASGLRVSPRGGIDDTHPRARAVQAEILRRMTPARKMELVEDANACAKELALAGLRSRHPEAGPEELKRRLIGLLLGEDLASKAFGPHPDRA